MSRTFIYVSCAGSRAIEVFALDTHTGETIPHQRLVLPGSPSPLKISPDGRLLLVGTKSENTLLTCSIDPENGELAVLGSAPCPGGPTYVSCSRTMRTAFAASYGDNLLAAFPLESNGRPLPVTQVERGLARAHAAVIDASDRWMLVPTLGADAIRVFRLADDGRFDANVPEQVSVRPGSGPRHLVFSPDNRHVHCLNELDGSIDLFDFDGTNGTLTLRQSVSMMPHGVDGKPWAAELRVSSDGAFLFATERRSSTLAVFSVETQNGQLALFGHYPTETQPRGMAIDPSSRWLAVAGQLSNHLTVYAVNPETGYPKERARVATGDDPICVEILTLP